MDLRDQLQKTLTGSYTLGRELGGGGMSRVFVAEEHRLKRTVVVKVLSPELAEGISAERFEREIQTAASLQQANIVPLLSAGDTNGIPYYMMPFVDGESLRVRLGQGAPVSVREAIRILTDVARALAYAHGHGVVHRDIKPDNILLSGGTAVVTDFGIAKAISASRTGAGAATLTQLGTSIGTPAYIAPEQAAGDPAVDHRADLYSFGCLAYELLSGRPPFAGLTPQRLIAAHLSEPPVPIAERRPELPPALATLVMRCLAKDPAERPQSAGDLLAALDTVTSGAPASTTTPAPLPSGRGMLGRALAIYAAAFVVVAVTAKAAIMSLGLPDWVFPGAIVVMALGLPMIMFTAYGASPQLSWRRTTLGGATAIGAFVVIVGGYMLLRALGIGPVGSLFAAGTLKRHQTVLVTDFRVPIEDSTLVPVLGEAVRTALGESPDIVVLQPTAILDALQLMQRPSSTRIDLPVAKGIALRDGVAAIVDGDVTTLGPAYIISIRLVTPDSGLVLTTDRETAAGPTDLMPAVDRLTRRLRAKMGESLKSIRADPPLERVTTESIEAARRYAEGSRAASQGDDGAAIAALDAAVRLDSSFSMAWRGLAVVLGNRRGTGDARRADTAITHAYEHLDRLTARERYLTLAYYYSRAASRDRAKAMAAYDTALQLNPNEAGALVNLGVILEGRRDFVRAESLYVRAAVVRSTFSEWLDLVEVRLSMGRAAAAESTLQQLRQRFPTFNLFDGGSYIVADVLYNRGQIDSAAGQLRLLRTNPDPLVRRNAEYRLADLAELHGSLDEYYRLRFAGRAIDTALKATPLLTIDDSLNLAYDDLWYRDARARGTARVDAAVARFGKTASDYPFAARLYALAGRPDRARAMLAQWDAGMLDAAARKRSELQRDGMLGEIALAEHHPLAAADDFRLADRLPDGPATECTICLPANLARAYDQADMPDSAIANFERYVSGSFYNRMSGGYDPIYLAGTYKRLGELYEAKGDLKKAILNFGKFVDLWQHADADLQPKVAEARRRLTLLADRAPR